MATAPSPSPSPTRGEGIVPGVPLSFPAYFGFRSSLPSVGERQREGVHGVRCLSKFVPNTIEGLGESGTLGARAWERERTPCFGHLAMTPPP
jgi:hypothetical protein